MDKIEQCLNEPPSRASRFPDTPWSIVLAASAHSEQAGVALAELGAAYRQPIYRWLSSLDLKQISMPTRLNSRCRPKN